MIDPRRELQDALTAVTVARVKIETAMAAWPLEPVEPPVLPGISIEDATPVFPGELAVFPWKLSAASVRAITIGWQLRGPTNILQATSGALTIMPGSEVGTIPIRTNPGALPGPFEIQLFDPTHATIEDGVAFGQVLAAPAPVPTGERPARPDGAQIVTPDAGPAGFAAASRAGPVELRGDWHGQTLQAHNAVWCAPDAPARLIGPGPGVRRSAIQLMRRGVQLTGLDFQRWAGGTWGAGGYLGCCIEGRFADFVTDAAVHDSRFTNIYGVACRGHRGFDFFDCHFSEIDSVSIKHEEGCGRVERCTFYDTSRANLGIDRNDSGGEKGTGAEGTPGSYRSRPRLGKTVVIDSVFHRIGYSRGAGWHDWHDGAADNGPEYRRCVMRDARRELMAFEATANVVLTESKLGWGQKIRDTNKFRSPNIVLHGAPNARIEKCVIALDHGPAILLAHHWRGNVNLMRMWDFWFFQTGTQIVDCDVFLFNAAGAQPSYFVGLDYHVKPAAWIGSVPPWLTEAQVRESTTIEGNRIWCEGELGGRLGIADRGRQQSMQDGMTREQLMERLGAVAEELVI